MSIPLIFLLLLPLTVFGEEMRIAVGMDRDDAVTIIQRHGGVDITPGLAVVGRKGEYPFELLLCRFAIMTSSLSCLRAITRLSG
jgi:hypothetical protein